MHSLLKHLKSLPITRLLGVVLCAGLLPSATLAGTTSPVSTSTTTLPALVVGKAVQVDFSAAGGTPPYTWSLPLSPLPPGLSLNAATGRLSGTPTTAGNFVVFVRATDTAAYAGQRGWNVSVSYGSSTSGGGTSSPPPAPATFVVTVVNGALPGGGAAGSFPPGSTVTLTAAAAPAGQWFRSWSGPVTFAAPGSPTTTFTMPSAAVTVSANYFTPPTLVQPVTGHPRLWLNAADLPRLRSWAVSSNPIYQQGLRVALGTALSAYNRCFPGGQPAVPYPDLGDIYGYAGAQIQSADLVSEHHALVLALFALIDPDPSARAGYAAKARRLFMYEIHEAAKGHAAGLPFRDPIFALFNRTHSVGEAWPLIADWLQGVTDANGQPVQILTAADKAEIRSVFLQWSADCLNAYICGGDHPAPVGITNSPMLLPNGNAHRVAANNYYSSHARLVTMLPLALDPADDPAVDPSAPEGLLGNTLRSYLPNATGAWLYQQFALYGDAAAVRSAYGLPANAGVGHSSGGLPVEGSLYGHSYGYILGQLLSLQTAGFGDSALIGPQAALLKAPVWDRFASGFIAQMVNTPFVPASATYLGAVYQVAGYGDMLRAYMTNDFMVPYALLALLRAKQGDTAFAETARWFAVHAMPGGASQLLSRVAYPWSTSESILYFMLMDPKAPAPADPRPNYPLEFVDDPQARVLVRSDWGPNATLFTYRAGQASINHENNDAGQFELWRKGEWLTRELSNYDNYGNGQSTLWHNTLALKNWCQGGTPLLNPFEAVYFSNGSTWNNGLSQGDPRSVWSTTPAYACVQTVLTPCYNRPSPWTPSNALLDVTHASRTLVHLRNDRIVVYDRAESVHSGLFKRFNLNLAAVPVFTTTAAGPLATAVTPKGQRLHLTTLAPAGAVHRWVPAAGMLTNVAELDNVAGRVEVEAPGLPASARFLHVIEASDTSAPSATVRLVSEAGTPFEGVLIAGNAVLFARDLGTSFAGVTFTVPSGTTRTLVTGLAPGGFYDVTAEDLPGGLRFTVSPGTATRADAAGVLVF